MEKDALVYGKRPIKRAYKKGLVVSGQKRPIKRDLSKETYERDL